MVGASLVFSSFVLVISTESANTSSHGDDVSEAGAALVDSRLAHLEASREEGYLCQADPGAVASCVGTEKGPVLATHLQDEPDSELAMSLMWPRRVEEDLEPVLGCSQL